jgi:diguanylate cyclase (GGDEF)-like protein
MSVRPGRHRTLNSRLLVWLSCMLFPVIAGGVVGIALQQRQIHQTRAMSERIGTTFLSIERAHRALHAAEVAATARAQAPGEPATDAALWAAEARAAGALADLEAITADEHLAPVRRARALWGRADVMARTSGLRPAGDRRLRAMHALVFAAQGELEALTDVAVRRVRDGDESAGDHSLQALALVVSFLLSSAMAVALALHLRRAIGSPLGRLRLSARRLGRGDLDHRVELNSFAEFGEVADSLNAMASRLAESQRELSRRASHDELTGLADRSVLFERVERALARMAPDRAVAVLFIDVDDFKAVNDSLGHTVGDGVLSTIAARLRDAVRPSDSIARLGGDEFAVLVEDMREADGGVRLAERILLALSAPMLVGSIEVSLGGSVGVAIATAEDRTSGEDLLRAADLAMYAAKADGKRRYRTFEPSMLAGAVERLELEADLKRAVERDELDVHYQPIVELATGVVRGVEALARWNHPQRGPVAPDVFIALAERTGLIVPLGRRLLERACADLPHLRARLGHERLLLGVNLSTRELLDPELPERMTAALAAAGLGPGALTIEITESVLMSDVEAAKARLAELKERGALIAVDDFGTGYSSLAYLRQFPVDCLKIDRAFVDSVADTGSEDHSLVRTILSLGETRGLIVIAEGVEHAAQRDELHRLGCELGQGYLFCRPMSADDLAVVLRGRALVGA